MRRPECWLGGDDGCYGAGASGWSPRLRARAASSITAYCGRAPRRRASFVEMRLDGSPAGTPSTRPQSRTPRENILVFNAGLGSTSTPRPPQRSPRPPNSCPLCARSPSGTMSKGRDATTITDSTGRRRLTKLGDGAAAARCGRLRVGPAATPRRPRDCVGSTAFWSCALALGPSRRRARRCRDAHFPRRCCFVSGTRPYRTGASGTEFSRPGDSAVGEPSLHTNGRRG